MESTLRDLAPAGLVIIETLGYAPKDGFRRLGLHVDRAERTCARLGVRFDRGETLFALGSSVDALPARVRMAIDLAGTVSVTTAELTTPPAEWVIAVADVTLQSEDPWLGVKTSQRAIYDEARAALPEGVDEMIFLNERSEVCEGTITNLFVERGGILRTPPLSCGVLPGVLRQELLDTGRAEEAVLSSDDLKAGDIFVGNSLRGLIKARLV